MTSLLASAEGGLAPRAAHAQTTDGALAETLFQEGKRLMDAGNFAQACPKLAESHKLEPAGGTVLAAAICFEKAGRIASAWAAFTEALAIANRDKRSDRAKFATEQLSALELRLPRVSLTIPLPVRTMPSVALSIDGRPLPPAAWDTRTPVDPGPHTLTVRADGHDPAETKFTIADGELKTVAVPAPKPSPAKPTPPLTSATASPAIGAAPTGPTPDERPPRALPAAETRPTLVPGLAVGGVGLVAIAVGSAFGASALSKTNEANDRCPRARCADKDAIALNDTAGGHATAATVLIPAGVVIFAVGAFLAVRKSPAQAALTPRAQLVQIVPTVGRDAASLHLGGAF